MTLMAILILAAIFLSAWAGGLLALHLVRLAAVIIAVGAGIRIGAAFFDLIPEAAEQLGSLNLAMLTVASGFLFFYLLEQLTRLHFGHEASTELDHDSITHRHLGDAGVAGMGLHSVIDGIALATALSVGGGLGITIAVVVVAHRFSDGVSVVGMLAGRRSSRVISQWILLIAIAPILGLLLGMALPLPAPVLGAVLGFFAGFFLYVGTAELLPEAHRTSRSPLVALATILGMSAMYALSLTHGIIDH